MLLVRRPPAPSGGWFRRPLDFSYLLLLAQHYGQPATFAADDLNADGFANFDDLLLLAQNYNHRN